MRLTTACSCLLPSGDMLQIRSSRTSRSLRRCRPVASIAAAAILLAVAFPRRAAGEIQIDGPGVLDKSGETYVLTRDIESPGTCFILKGSDITVDLGGHTVTYGTAAGENRYGVVLPTSYYDTQWSPVFFPGVPVDAFGGARRVRIRNGTLLQGAANDRNCHGIYTRGTSGIIVEDLTIRVRGTDTDNIYLVSPGPTTIQNCTFYSDVRSVTNRHYPGQDVVVIWGVTGDIEIHDNKVIGGAQWGIRIQESDTSKHYRVHVYRNDVRHDARVTNAYAIGCKAPYMEVYDNVIVPVAGRGIHVTGYASRVYRNTIEVRERYNEEFPLYATNGIHIEQARGCKIYENDVTAVADPGTNNARAIEIHVDRDSGNEVYDNVFRGISNTNEFYATAVMTSPAEDGSKTLVRDNVFESNNNLYRIYWDGGSGITFLRDTFRLLDNPRSPVTFYFWMGNQSQSVNNVFVDCTFEGGASPHDFGFLYDTYASDRTQHSFQSTLTLFVVAPGGAPAEGAEVRIAGTGEAEWVAGETDASGRLEARATWLVRTPAGETVRPSHRVRVIGGEGVSEFSVDMRDGPKAFEVVLGSNTPVPKDPDPGEGEDRIPPKAPAGLRITLD